MTRDELIKLLDAAPLPADASKLALRGRVNDQQRLIRYLLDKVAAEAKSIIEIRTQIVAQKSAIEFLAGMVGAEVDEGPIIGVRRPALTLPAGIKRQ